MKDLSDALRKITKVAEAAGISASDAADAFGAALHSVSFPIKTVDEISKEQEHQFPVVGDCIELSINELGAAQYGHTFGKFSRTRITSKAITKTLITDVRNKKITSSVIGTAHASFDVSCSFEIKEDADCFLEDYCNPFLTFAILRKRKDVAEIIKHGTYDKVSFGTASIMEGGAKRETVKINLNLSFWI